MTTTHIPKSQQARKRRGQQDGRDLPNERTPDAEPPTRRYLPKPASGLSASSEATQNGSSNAPTEPGAVDPRMRARRSDVEQAAKLRHKKTILALVFVTASAVFAMFAVQSSLLDVDKILITGAVQSDLSAVRDATAIQIGEPLLELDLDAAAANVGELPWVQSAWVERKMNGDITIHVEERVAFAVLPTINDDYVVVDRSGLQLAGLSNRPAGFIPINGVEASGVVGTPAPPSAQAAMKLIGSVSDDLATHIERIYFDEADLYLDLKEGGRVALGSDSGLTDKLVSLETMLDRVDLRCLFEIDLRVPSAPALTRESATGVIGASLTNLADCS